MRPRTPTPFSQNPKRTKARHRTHPGRQEHAADVQNIGRTSGGDRGRARKEQRPGRGQLYRHLRHFPLRIFPKHGFCETREGNFAAICGTCSSGARQTGPHARAGGESDRNESEMARECSLISIRSPVFLAFPDGKGRIRPRGGTKRQRAPRSARPAKPGAERN